MEPQEGATMSAKGVNMGGKDATISSGSDENVSREFCGLLLQCSKYDLLDSCPESNTILNFQFRRLSEIRSRLYGRLG